MSWPTRVIPTARRPCRSRATTRAKATALALARDLGFEPVDAGPLAMARYLEPFAMLWIKFALVQGLGRRFAFRLLRR